MPKYHVERSIHIDMPAERVFEAVADFSTWKTWSPWLCAEPEAKVTVSANSNSIGSKYAWEGTVVGAGEIEHLELRPGKSIVDEIRFFKPFRSISRVSFLFEPKAGGTKLTWSMDGSLPFFLFWLSAQLQAIIGMDFDRGLRMLKEWLETGKIISQTNVRGVVPIGPLHMLGVQDSCAVNDVGRSMEDAFRKARQIFEREHLSTAGPMISVYHKFDMKNQRFEYTSGFVLPESKSSSPPELTSWAIPAVQAMCVEHIGSYEHLGNAWSAANQIAQYRKLKQSKHGTFEIYTVAGSEVPAAETRAEIYLPLKQ